MQNEQHRELMRAFYKLYEQYETTPKGMNDEETGIWFEKLSRDVDDFWHKWLPDATAKFLGIALLSAREEEWKADRGKSIEWLESWKLKERGLTGIC